MEKSNHIAAEPAVEPKTHAEHIKPSFGERAFNWITYGAWHHGVNLILSTILAMTFKGSKTYNRTIERVQKLGISQDSAAMATDITLLSMGGHITALGVKPLEDRKQEIVRSINKKHSPQEVDAPLADDRKQTWLSVIGARAFTLIFAIFGSAGIKVVLGNNEHNVPRMDAFQDRIGRKFAGITKSGKTAADITTTTSYKLGKLLSLEVIVVSLMSTLFYFTSKLLSKKEPQLLPAKVKPQAESGITMADAEPEQPKTNFAERVREQEAAESLGVVRA